MYYNVYIIAYFQHEFKKITPCSVISAILCLLPPAG